MNRSANNVHRSPSSQGPLVTPPRRTARLPLSPNNRPHANANPRRHLIPLCGLEQNTGAPHSLPLIQANARLIHERLQQNHTRLQVQLRAPAPSTSPSTLPAGPVKTLLDTTFRAYASRIQAEFTGLRAACARAVQREQHQTAEMRSACARLVRERDVAQERLRVLLGRAEGGKRTRAQVDREDADADEDLGRLRYPPSPVSAPPPQLPIQSPPPRLRSPFVLAVRRSPTHTPDPEDRTGFDLTVSCDSFPRPAKKRRVSDGDRDSSAEQAREEKNGGATGMAPKERETCPAAAPGYGECDMELESGSDSESAESDSASSRSRSKSRSTSASRAPSAAPPPSRSPAAAQQRPTPPPSASASDADAKADDAHLDLEYVDIMYLPADGKLVCRVCLLAAAAHDDSRRSPPTMQAFGPGASWEALRAHCEGAHPEACRDVKGLGRAGVSELRRRLGLGVIGR